jgi:hypothetical protein
LGLELGWWLQVWGSSLQPQRISGNRGKDTVTGAKWHKSA